MFIKGKDVILKIGGTAIAAAKSCDVNIQADLIKVSSPTDGGWEHSIAGRKSWSASCSHLVTQIASSAAIVGQTVTLTFQPTSEVVFSGTVSHPPLTSGTAPSTGNMVFDTVRKEFLLVYSPAPGVTLYFEDFNGKPALIVGAYYYNRTTGKCYQWSGTAMNEVQALTGSAIVKQWKGTFTTGNLAQGSYSFEGSGALSTQT